MNLSIFNFNSLNRIIIKDLLILFGILFCLEISLHVFFHNIFLNNIYDTKFTGGHLISINNYGVRGKNLDKKISKNTEVFLGDSVTYATGISIKDMFTSQYKNKLLTQNKLNTVINAGYPGAGIQDLIFLYDSDWRKFKPKKVFLIITPQMISRSFINHNNKTQFVNKSLIDESQLPSFSQVKLKLLRLSKRYLCLPSFLRKLSEVFFYQIGIKNHFIPNPDQPYGVMFAYGLKQSNLKKEIINMGYKILEKNLNILNKKLDQHDCKLTIVYIPSEFSLSSTLNNNLKRIPLNRLTVEPGERIKNISNSLGINFIDVSQIFREINKVRKIYLPFDYSHLNIEGHTAVSNILNDHCNNSNSR